MKSKLPTYTIAIKYNLCFKLFEFQNEQLNYWIFKKAIKNKSVEKQNDDDDND